MTAPRRAPTFPDGLEWLNCARPLTLDGDLAGRAVVIHFFRASSVHCLHVLQMLEYVEQCHAGRPLTIIGVHRGKFPAERELDEVRRALRRLGVHHPVAVDDGTFWDAYGIRAWPTLCLVDRGGTVRFQGAGEPNRDRLNDALDVLVCSAENGAPSALEFFWPESADDPAEAPAASDAVSLASPSGLAVDDEAGLLWIADTGHHRLLAVDLLSGELRHTVGAGAPGGGDGDASYATLHLPRGLAVDTGAVYVADAGNHSIRVVDLDHHEVRTLVGQGRPLADTVGGLCGTGQGLASPWDVCADDRRLFVAMAGVHELWTVDLDDECASACAGTGAEGLLDGVRHDAELAQPAGVAVHDGVVAFVDSESSSVRTLDPTTELVTTLVGHGMFSFGDVDGDCETARLQHPLGIEWSEDGRSLWIADTLNDKLRRVDVGERTVETVLGPGDGLCRPEAVVAHGDRLFVADTGNHRILDVDVRTREATPLEIVDPHPEYPEPEPEPIQLRAETEVSLCFPMPNPAGSLAQPDASPRAWLRDVTGEVFGESLELRVEPEGEWGVVRGIRTVSVGEGAFELLVRSMTCEDLDGVAHVQQRRGRFAVELTADGPDVADLPLQ